MAGKPDYYSVLGVDKKASVDDIKKACNRIIATCHPDAVNNNENLSPAQKQAACEKFQYAQEAKKVLLDPAKRAAYDVAGHEGLASMKESSSSGCNPAATTVHPSVIPKPTAENAFDFFIRRSDEAATGKTASGARETPEERERAARKAREDARKAREAARRTRQDSSDTPASSNEEDPLDQVSKETGSTIRTLKEAFAAGADLPLDKLERFRENLADLQSEVEKAIARARKSGGPRPQ